MATGTSQNQIQIPGYLRISKVIAYILYFWIIIGVISLSLRVFLLLFSANPNTSFVDFIYRLSSDYLEPFRGIFPPKAVSETGYLDVAAVFAIIVYLFVMWGVSALISYVQYKIDTSTHEQEKELARIRLEKSKATKSPVKVQ
jgi:uncharacterized protein YggT (Ycf19 family)